MSSRAESIVAICMAATAHNYGPTIQHVDQSFLSDEITVQMSSWPRADEAIAALLDAGYIAEHFGDAGVLVRAS